MNIPNREWFCVLCSLQFDSKLVYNLHLKLLHKHIIQKKSIKNKCKSNDSLTSYDKSDSTSKILLDQAKKKIFECKICEYNFSQRKHLNVHIASVHEEKKYSIVMFVISLFLEKVT